MRRIGAEPAGATEGRDTTTGLSAEEEAAEDPELTLTVFGNRLKRKRSELISAYDLEGLDDDRIIKVAQKEIAADQRLAEAKEAVDQRLQTTEHLKCLRKPSAAVRQTSRIR